MRAPVKAGALFFVCAMGGWVAAVSLEQAQDHVDDHCQDEAEDDGCGDGDEHARIALVERQVAGEPAQERNVRPQQQNHARNERHNSNGYEYLREVRRRHDEISVAQIDGDGEAFRREAVRASMEGRSLAVLWLSRGIRGHHFGML